jgi:hypothetical protein
MKFLEKLIRKPETMQRVIGVKPEQLILLSKNIEPLWQAEETKRLDRDDRKRAMGAGHPYSFETIQEKIAAVLFYYKSYPTQEVVGLTLGVNQSAISRLFRRIIPLIEDAADPELKSFLNTVKEACDKEKIKTLEKLLEKFPELKDVSGDATEQPCYRSEDYKTQEDHYSGKSKQHAIKTQIEVSFTGKILDVSDSYPGKTHDKAIMNLEKTIEKFPKFVPQRFDSGYQGICTDYPDHNLILHCKKPKGRELTSLDKEYNKANSKRRVIAEHVFSRFKKFRILGNVFRNNVKIYNKIFRGVAALLNFKLANPVQVA